MKNLPNITPEIIKAYQDSLATTASPATTKRKAVSLNRFFDWAHSEGKIQQNPLAKSNQETSNNIVISPNTSNQKNTVTTRTWATVGITATLIILIFLLTFKLKFPIPFTLNFAQEAAIQTNNNLNVVDTTNTSSPSGSFSANNAVVGAWNIYTKLKLTDASGSPIVGPQTLSYKIYNSEKDGSALFTSPSQNITTDTNGSALLSLSNVPTDLFFQNEKLYIEPSIGSGSATLRIPVSTASTPANLNGFFPANPTLGATNESIPVIDANGTLVLASQSPAIVAKKGNFLMEGQAVTLKTTDGGDGNIEINPDGKGIAHFLFEGNKGNFLNAQGPNLTSGSLYYGMVPNNATGYDLIRLQSGSPKMTTKFSVDALGNTYIASDLNVAGDIATGGVDRITSTGNLKNITGYSQNSGNFTVNQNPGDFASIIKKGSALSDVLNLTLDERGYPNSSYSTLTLNRFNGAPEAAALHVDEGNAIFDGQVQLGRFSSNPSAIGQGSLVFNTGDNKVYVWDGSTWVAVGSGGGTSAFADLTSGTNTTASMVVGSGASLTFSGTGTITASDLICSGCVSNSELANSSITFSGDSGTSAISLGGTENIVGTNSISTSQSGSTLTVTAANATTSTVGVASFDSNFFTVTSGNVSIANDSLDFAQLKDSMSLDAATNIALGALTLSTSGTGALNFASSGQVTFAGNVDATSGIDVSGSNLTVATNSLLNGDTTLGDAITDNITFTGRVAQDSDLIPITTTGTNDLGTALLPWDNIYGGTFTGNGSGLTNVDAATLDSLDSLQFLRSDTSDNFTSGTLTTDAGTTFDVNGDLVVSDANIAFDAASTTFTTTGDLILALGGGDIDLSGQTTGIILNNAVNSLNIDSNTLSVDALNNRVGIGDASPVSMFTVGAGDLFQIDSSGRIINLDGVAHTIDDVAGDLTLTSNSTSVVVNDDLAVNGGDITSTATNLTIGTNGSATGNIQIGSATPSTTPDLLVVDKKSDAGNPIGSTGAIFINSTDKFMVNENGTWKELCNKVDQNCGSGTSSSWSGLTDPTADLTLDMAAYTTAFDWTVTGASSPWSMSLLNNAGSATAQNFVTLTNAVTTQTNDVNTESLILLDNADTSAAGSTVVDNAILITNSGGIANGITDAIDASAGDIVNALNFGANVLLGTTGNIDMTNFDVVGTTGNITTAGDIAVNGGDITSTGALTVTPGAGTNLNIALSTTGDFAVNTNQLYVDTSTGNVGIGDASPASLFTVGAGDLFQIDSNGRIVSVEGVGHIIEDTGGSLTLTSNSTSVVVNDDLAVNGGDITSTSSLTITPASGTNLNIALSTTGDFAVNTNQLYVDTSTGNVGIGDATPANTFTVGAGDLFQIDSSGRIVKIDGVSHTIDDVTGDLTLTSNSTSVVVNDDLAVNGATSADITSSTTTASIFDSTVTTLTIGGAATTIGIGNASGTTTINGALAVNGDTTLGDAITDNITFTGRVAQDSDLIPITTTGTNDLGTALLPWDNIYGGTFTGNGSGLTNVDAATLDSLDSLQFLRSDTSDNFTSGTLTTDAGTTFDVNGDLVVSDANIAFDAASTTFSATGDLIFGSNGASTGNVQIGSATPSTSPDLLVLDKKSDAGNPTGSTGAIFLNSSDKFMINENGTWKELCNKTDQACGTGTGSSWSALTVPTSNLSLSMGAYTTAFDWTVTGASSPWSMSLLNNAGSATSQNFLTLSNSVTTQTNDVNTESLILLDNADTSAAGSTVVDNGILITNSGGIANGITDAIDASAGDIVNALNFGANVLLGTTGNIDMTNFDVVGTTGNITTAGDIAVNGGDITSTGALTVTPGAGTNLNIALSTTGDFAVNTNQLYVDTSTGNVGIGTSAPNTDLTVIGSASVSGHLAVGLNSAVNNGSLLYPGSTYTSLVSIQESITDLASYDYLEGITNYLQLNPGAAPSATTYGIDTEIETKATNSENFGSIYGGYNSIVHKGTGTANGLYAAFNTTSKINAAGVITSATGSYNDASGATTTTGIEVVGSKTNGNQANTAGDLYGIKNTTSNTLAIASGTDNTYGNKIDVVRTGATGGTINSYGEYISMSSLDNAGAGTSNAYGLYIASISGADNNYSIYSAGGANYFAGSLTTDGNVQLGNAITDTIDFQGRVLQDSDLIPVTTTGTNDLGTALLPWDNIYGVALYQNGNPVCDSSGANCPAGSTNFWGQNLGALFTVNNSVDVLIGSDSTASAKFAFTGVSAGTPTASISGTTANVATFIDGNGNISSTNKNNLTLGNSTTYNSTGNILLNPNGTGNVGIGDATPANTFTVGSGDLFQIDSSGRIVSLDGVAHTIDDVAGDLTLTSNSTSVVINDDLAVNGGDITSTVDLTINPAGGQVIFADTRTLNVGGKTGLAYNAFANNADGPVSGAISSDNDLLVGGNFEAGVAIYTPTLTTTGDIQLNGGDLTTTALTATLFNTNATTLSLGGAATTLNIGKTGSGASSILLAGGSADTGCTINGATGSLTCSGDIATTATSGIQGWWQRNLGAVSPTNIGDDLIIGGISTASAKFQVESTGRITAIEGVAHTIDDVAGDLTLTSNSTSVVVNDDLAINGATSADITSTTTTATIFDSTVTTLSLGGAATTLNIGKTGSGASSIVLAGGSADTGCTLDGSNGNFTCSGNIATTATSGIQGWWQRNDGVVSPTNIGDDLTIGGISTASAKFQVYSPTGNIVTAGDIAVNGGDITSTGALTVTPGAGTNLNIALSTTGDFAVNTNQLYVDTSTGKVGIGTATEQAEFNVFGDMGSYKNGNTSVGSPIGASLYLGENNFYSSSYYNSAPGLSALYDPGTSVSGSLGFYVYNSLPNSRLEAMRIIGTTGNVGIGDSTPTATLTVGSGDLFQVAGASGNITTAGDAAINGGDLTSTATTFNFDIGNTGTLNFRDGTNTMVAISDQGTTGRLAVSDSLQVGGLTTVAYSRIGTTAAGHTGNITTSADFMVSGDFELDGNLYLDGKNIYNTNGNAAIILCTGNSGADCSTTSAQENTLSTGSWVIDNQVNVGEPVLALNNAKGGDLLVASASGTLKFKVANNGDVTLGDNSGTDLTVGGGTGKVDAGTIDPPYTINGKKFATFLSGIVGVKEEVVGQAVTSEYVSGVGYRYLVDFNNLPEGSDLWLFSKATDIKTNIEKLVALLTPSDPTRVWYEVDKTNKRLAIYSARPTTISYRLTGPRFDHENWSNYRSEDSVAGFVLNIPDMINTNPIAVNIQNMSDFAINKIQNGYYQILDSGNHVVDGVESIGNFVAGNIKSGAIATSELATNTFQAAQGTIDNLLITSGLVTPNAKIALISPIPNTTDITVKIGDQGTDSGKLAIKNNDNVEVAAIDTKGNANFAGNVHSQNIDEIQSILNQVTTDQSFLSQVVNSSIKTASNSAEFTTLATDDLYVTGQAAVNSLSVTNTIAIGADLVLNSTDSSLNTLSSPLRIQSLALAPLEIMAGKVKINTNGDVTIAGNLYVAGDVKSKGIEIEDANQNSVAKVTASGSAEFNSLSTSNVVIAGAQTSTPSAAVNGQINSNATVGQAIIPAGTNEIRINNPKVGDYTLVYVTPTSNSENKVLYVKSKGAGYFTLGFSEAANVDVSFNWWIVATTE